MGPAEEGEVSNVVIFSVIVLLPCPGSTVGMIWKFLCEWWRSNVPLMLKMKTGKTKVGNEVEKSEGSDIRRMCLSWIHSETGLGLGNRWSQGLRAMVTASNNARSRGRAEGPWVTPHGWLLHCGTGAALCLCFETSWSSSTSIHAFNTQALVSLDSNGLEEGLRPPHLEARNDRGKYILLLCTNEERGSDRLTYLSSHIKKERVAFEQCNF